MNKTFSIVIIGRNEGDRLVRCLRSVLASNVSGDAFEVIYVDSNSSDQSVDNAKRFGATVIELKGVCSAARARNAGWREARGEWVLFLDGDTVLHADFLRNALRHTGTKNVAVVWGHRRELSPAANLYHRVLDLDWVYRPGPSEFCGGDALMRRSILEEVGGFDASFIAGEEPELCSRLRSRGYTILHIDAAMTGHDISISRFSQYWKHAVRAGYAYARLAQRTRHSAIPMWTSETKKNALRAIVLTIFFIALPLHAVWVQSWMEFAVAIALGAAITFRSAFRARWKGASAFTLLCYGVHSHLQQLPIFAGQLAFWLDRMRAQSREVIEYK